MASRALIPLLVGMMLLTGVCNTLLTKYQVRWNSLVLGNQTLTRLPLIGYAMRPQL